MFEKIVALIKYDKKIQFLIIAIIVAYIVWKQKMIIKSKKNNKKK